MTSTLVKNIGELVTVDSDRGDGLGIMTEVALVATDGRIDWIGAGADAPAADLVIDAEHRCVMPGFVDSHSHLVFAGDRSGEFEARMTGTPYDGGGIALTMAATRRATDDELRSLVRARVAQMRAQGTTTVEIKSGYGLTVADEVRALQIAGEFTTETTFLGAHVVPPDACADRGAYLDLVIGEMLGACAPHARWIDVFCEPHSPHAFSEEESRRVLRAGQDAGLLARVHGNQLGHGPGVQLAVQVGAASVDHCTYLSDEDIAALAESDTVATLLPGVEFSTRSPYPDARRLIDAGVQVALATDCNPGTCYSGSMPFMIAVAVREMGMTPIEAVRASTAGGAAALRRDDVGILRVGARADLAMLEAPSYRHLPYRPGVPLATVILSGG
ncbi:MAG: imidazolonepropionase [Actinomycetota bacterium]|nr:imidazolonepropionase [Actinomycetota bacterium]